MIDPTDARFFIALNELVDRDNAGCAALLAAVDRAIASGEPLDFLAARDALNALDDGTREDLLRQVHHRMATDLSAIWDSLPGALSRQRPN